MFSDFFDCCPIENRVRGIRGPIAKSAPLGEDLVASSRQVGEGPSRRSAAIAGCVVVVVELIRQQVRDVGPARGLAETCIAIVDDDESVRKALKRLLRAANLDADTFASGLLLLPPHAASASRAAVDKAIIGFFNRMGLTQPFFVGCASSR
jgi:hypothetical protein